METNSTDATNKALWNQKLNINKRQKQKTLVHQEIFNKRKKEICLKYINVKAVKMESKYSTKTEAIQTYEKTNIGIIS